MTDLVSFLLHPLTLSKTYNEILMLAFYRNTKRIWPTLLSAAAEAAVRASSNKIPRGGDVHTAIIMSRTAFDAYLHELISLRDLEKFVKLGKLRQNHQSHRRIRIFTIDDKRATLSSLPKIERENFRDIRRMDFDEKLSTIIELLRDVNDSFLENKAMIIFENMLWLNKVRNAIVHHDFGAPSEILTQACANIAAAAGAQAPEKGAPWEDLLSQGNVAIWACRVVASSILDVEAFERNRRIHLHATRDAVLAAISPLELSG